MLPSFIQQKLLNLFCIILSLFKIYRMKKILLLFAVTYMSIIVFSQNVGIGTTSPGEKLTVAGKIESTTGGIKFPDASVQVFSGKVIGVTYRVNSTRTPLLTGPSSITMESITVDKKSSTSILVIQGTVSGFGNYSGITQQGWKYGAGTEVLAQGMMYDENNFGKLFPTTAVIAGHTTTGPQTLVFRFFNNNGSPGCIPFTIYNPNSIDDTRVGQTSSVYIIWEVEEQ